jgi:hypothetical protein
MVEHGFISYTWFGISGQETGFATLGLGALASGALGLFRSRPQLTVPSLVALTISFGVSIAAAYPIPRMPGAGAGRHTTSSSMGIGLRLCTLASAAGSALCIHESLKTIDSPGL